MQVVADRGTRGLRRMGDQELQARDSPRKLIFRQMSADQWPASWPPTTGRSPPKSTPTPGETLTPVWESSGRFSAGESERESRRATGTQPPPANIPIAHSGAAKSYRWPAADGDPGSAEKNIPGVALKSGTTPPPSDCDHTDACIIGFNIYYFYKICRAPFGRSR